jgi:hypothetical protein
MSLTHFWMSIPKVNHDDNKAWTTYIFFLIDMKVTAKIPWPQLYMYFSVDSSQWRYDDS